MRCRSALFWTAAFVGSSLATAAGCLSLGGTTTHVHEDPGLKGRVSSLESRVSVLEEALQGSSNPSQASAP